VYRIGGHGPVAPTPKSGGIPSSPFQTCRIPVTSTFKHFISTRNILTILSVRHCNYSFFYFFQFVQFYVFYVLMLLLFSYNTLSDDSIHALWEALNTLMLIDWLIDSINSIILYYIILYQLYSILSFLLYPLFGFSSPSLFSQPRDLGGKLPTF